VTTVNILEMYGLERNLSTNPRKAALLHADLPAVLSHTSLLLRVPARHRADDINC